jgi:plastocyanin
MNALFPGKAAARTFVAAVSIWCISLLCPLQAAHAAPTTHTVVIEGMKFVPETITVKAGDTIVWVNKDFFPHTATAQDRSFDSLDIATGKKWQHVAKKPGTFSYVCTLHPTMKGTLAVK